MKKIILFLLLFYFCVNAQSLSNMYFLTEDIGWVQTITDNYHDPDVPLNTYRTTNGGITWTQLDTQYNYRNYYGFVNFQFVNDSVGFLYSGNNYLGKNIYKTIDKGETWQLINGSFEKRTVKFADEYVGYADSNNNGSILKTINGGSNWDIINHHIVSDNDWEVVTKDRVIIIYSQLWYKITTDGGISWRDKVFFNKPITSTEFNAIDIKFTDSLNGFVTIETGDYSYGNYNGVCRTTDGGETWTYIKNYMSGGLSMEDSLKGIQWINNFNLIDYGYVYYLTKDGFLTHNIMQRPSNKALNYFYYNCNGIYACGDSGYFAKSTDCGETWTELPFNVLNPTDVNESKSIINYNLQQNYPNPFNPSTKIKYSLPKQGLVTIKIYDVLGNEIKTLLNEEKQSGEYEVEFDGSILSSGIYFYQIQSGEFLDTKKMILMK